MEISEISRTSRYILACGSVASIVFMLLALVYIVFGEDLLGGIKAMTVVNGLGLYAERSLVLAVLSALIFEVAARSTAKQK